MLKISLLAEVTVHTNIMIGFFLPLTEMPLRETFLQKKSILDVWQGPKYALAQSTFTCSKLTVETLEQSVKYVQS